VWSSACPSSSANEGMRWGARGPWSLQWHRATFAWARCCQLDQTDQTDQTDQKRPNRPNALTLRQPPSETRPQDAARPD
jgi:hypothetical protein